jgi:hypothetical protein
MTSAPHPRHLRGAALGHGSPGRHPTHVPDGGHTDRRGAGATGWGSPRGRPQADAGTPGEGDPFVQAEHPGLRRGPTLDPQAPGANASRIKDRRLRSNFYKQDLCTAKALHWFYSMMRSTIRTLATLTRPRGAIRGATGRRHWATPCHYQRLSAQLDRPSSHIGQRLATCRVCLLSARIRAPVCSA